MNSEPFVFLLDTVFKIYIFLVLLRFLMQWMGADFFNPVAQFVVKITKPLLNPIRKIVAAGGHIDYASLIALFGLQALYGFLKASLGGAQVAYGVLAVWTIAELVNLFLNTLVIMIIVRALLSWINPGTYNPAISLLYNITDPILNFGKKLIPPISGIDLSPMIIIIGLEFIRRYVSQMFLEMMASVQSIAF
jgi:YggT family protein